MDAERWKRLQELFDAARLMDRGDRQDYLDRACGSNMKLRQEVTELLRFDTPTTGQSVLPDESILASSMDELSRLSADGNDGSRIGRHRLVEHIGFGGFGDVYLGVRLDDYTQKVAIKFLQKDRLKDDRLRQRFELERQILADLNHEGIARLIDGGTTPDGQPYLVMEYISGNHITDYCEMNHLDLGRRVRLFLQVCRSVAYAHQFGVIHRDIKPANIIVSRDGITKLVDFGIAKLLDIQASAHMQDLTQTGELPFTPDYASPEQVSGKRVGTATDVYSLAVLFFELLTGSRPFELSTKSTVDIVRTVCDVTPRKPSQAVRISCKRRSEEHDTSSSGAESRSDARHLRRLERQLSGDLDRIVLKALRKDPGRRYQSASEFAKDVQRYIDGLPVEAGGDSIAYRAGKLVQRHRTSVAAGALALLSLVVCLVIAAVAWQRSRIAADRYHEQLYAADTKSAFDAMQRGDFKSARRIAKRLVPSSGQTDQRGVEWGIIRTIIQRDAPSVAATHTGSINELALVPGKPWVVSVGDDAMVQVWDVQNGRRVTTLGPADGALHSVAVSSDGLTIATGSQNVQLWDLATGKCRDVILKCDHTVESLAFSPVRNEIAVGVRYHDITVLPLDGVPPITVSSGGNRHERLAYMPNGHSLVYSTEHDGADVLQIWNCKSKRIVREFREDVLRHMAISSDGRWIAATSHLSLGIHVYDTLSGGRVHTSLRNGGGTIALAFSPDDSLLAGGSDDGTVVIWQFDVKPIQNESEATVDDREFEVRLERCDSFLAETKTIHSLHFANNDQIVTGGADGVVKTWTVERQRGARMLGPTDTTLMGASMAVNAPVFAGVDTLHNSLWIGQPHDLDSWQQLQVDTHAICSVALSPAGELLAVGTFEGTIELFKRNDLHAIASLRHCADRYQILDVCFSQDGQLLASSATDKSTCIWDVARQSLVHRWRWKNNAGQVAFDPSCRWLAIATQHSGLKLMDIRNRRMTESLELNGVNWSLAWSGSGRRLAAGQSNGEIVLFDLPGRSTIRIPAHPSSVTGLAFSPDNRTLVSVGGHGEVCLWQVATGRSLGTLYRAPERTYLSAVFFSPSLESLIVTHCPSGRTHPIMMWRYEE